MDKCTCGSGIETLYICTKISCPQYDLRRYYCASCSQQEDYHDHRPLNIKTEAEKQLGKWKKFSSELSEHFTKLNDSYKQLKPLVLYLEKIMTHPQVTHPGHLIWVSVELSNLEELNTKVQACFRDKVVVLFTNLKISELC